jgi:multidrug efflux system membrane fusion protein
MKRISMMALFSVIAAMAGGGYWYWQKSSAAGADKGKVAAQGKDGKEGKGKGKGKGGPVAVRMTTAKRQAMPVVIDAVGGVEPENSVAVRPQVGGTLTAVLFKEGDYVKQGQVLFRIDSRPMQVSVAQTQAAVSRDEAQLAQARAQEQRLRPLAEKEYITRQEYDVAATQAKSLEATVTANKAVVEAAQLQLSYSQITSPISGRTGSLSVKAGTLLAAGTAGTPLVLINSTKPVLVALSVPQRNLDDIRAIWGKRELKVEIAPNGGGPLIAKGTLVFIDNAVNPTTGTILVKARVKNEKEELWPGQFVSGRIVLRIEEDAVTVPESAIQPGQEGPFVYVVKEGRARLQYVTVDRQIGRNVVVSKGLEGEEQLIIEVPPTLTNGSQVVLAGSGAGKGGGGKGGGKKGGEEGGKEVAKEGGKEGGKEGAKEDGKEGMKESGKKGKKEGAKEGGSEGAKAPEGVVENKSGAAKSEQPKQ